MIIPCPHCGPRALQEFTYAGSAEVARPHAFASAADWSDYVHFRENRFGPHREYWHHIAGCRAVLIVDRNTATHAITQASFARNVAAL